MENRLTKTMPFLIAVRLNDYSKFCGRDNKCCGRDNKCCGRWTEYRWVKENKWEIYFGSASEKTYCSVCGSSHYSEKMCENKRRIITTTEILEEMQKFKDKHMGDINFFTEIAAEKFADGQYYYKKI